MATVVNPKFVAPKPAAPAAPTPAKATTYSTPAVIAKPASGGYSGIPSSNFTDVRLTRLDVSE